MKSEYSLQPLPRLLTPVCRVHVQVQKDEREMRLKKCARPPARPRFPRLLVVVCFRSVVRRMRGREGLTAAHPCARVRASQQIRAVAHCPHPAPAHGRRLRRVGGARQREQAACLRTAARDTPHPHAGGRQGVCHVGSRGVRDRVGCALLLCRPFRHEPAGRLRWASLLRLLGVRCWCWCWC